MYKGNINKNEIEFLEENIIFENKFIKISNDKVLFPSNKEGTYIRLKGGNGGVLIIPVLSDNNICLQENFRHAARKWILEFPKGYIENGESPLEAAKKELKEEMGLSSEDFIFLGYTYESPAINESKTYIYLAKNCTYNENDVQMEFSECFRNFKKFSFDDLIFKCKNNQIEFSLDESALLKLIIYNNEKK